eukprot:jgi/Mesvir1/15457/Mv11438-RA.1
MNFGTASAMLTKRAVGRLLLLGDCEGRIPLPVCTVQVLAIIPVLTDEDSYMSDTFLLKISDGDEATYVLLDTRHRDLIYSDALGLGKMITIGGFLASRPLPIATEVEVVSDAMDCIGSPEELAWMAAELPSILAQVAASARRRRGKSAPAHTVTTPHGMQAAATPSDGRLQQPQLKPTAGPVSSAALVRAQAAAGPGVGAERSQGVVMAAAGPAANDALGPTAPVAEASSSSDGPHWVPQVQAEVLSPRSPRSRWALGHIDSARFALRCSRVAPPSTDADTSRSLVEDGCSTSSGGSSAATPSALSSPTAPSFVADATSFVADSLSSPSRSTTADMPTHAWPPDQRGMGSVLSTDTALSNHTTGSLTGYSPDFPMPRAAPGHGKPTEGAREPVALPAPSAATPWEVLEPSPPSSYVPPCLSPHQQPVPCPPEPRYSPPPMMMVAAHLATAGTVPLVAAPRVSSAARADELPQRQPGDRPPHQQEADAQIWHASPLGDGGDMGPQGRHASYQGPPAPRHHHQPSPLRRAHRDPSPEEDADALASSPVAVARHNAKPAQSRLSMLLQDMDVGLSGRNMLEGADAALDIWHAHKGDGGGGTWPPAASAWDPAHSFGEQREEPWGDSEVISGTAGLQRSVSHGDQRGDYSDRHGDYGDRSGGCDDEDVLSAAVVAAADAAASFRSNHLAPPPDEHQRGGMPHPHRQRFSEDTGGPVGGQMAGEPAWHSHSPSPYASQPATYVSGGPVRAVRHPPQEANEASWPSSAVMRPKHAPHAATLLPSASSPALPASCGGVEPAAASVLSHPTSSHSTSSHRSPWLDQRDDKLDRLRSRSFSEIRRAVQDPDSRPLWPPAPEGAEGGAGSMLPVTRQGSGGSSRRVDGEASHRARSQPHKEFKAEHGQGSEDAIPRHRSHPRRGAGNGPQRTCLLSYERFPPALLPVARGVANLRERALRRALFALEEAEAADLCLEMWGEYFALAASYSAGDGGLLRIIRAYVDWHRRARVAVDMILAAAPTTPSSPPAVQGESSISPTAHDLVQGAAASARACEDGTCAAPHVPLSDAKEQCAAIRHRLQERVASAVSHTLARSNSAPLAAATPPLAMGGAAARQGHPAGGGGGAAPTQSHAATMPSGGGSHAGHHHGHHHHGHHAHSHSSSAAPSRTGPGPSSVSRAFSSPMHTTPAPLRPAATTALPMPPPVADEGDGGLLGSPPSQLRTSSGHGEGGRGGSEGERGNGPTLRGGDANRAASPALLLSPRSANGRAGDGVEVRPDGAAGPGSGARTDRRGAAVASRGKDVGGTAADGDGGSGRGRGEVKVTMPSPGEEMRARKAAVGKVGAALGETWSPPSAQIGTPSLVADARLSGRPSKASRHVRSISFGGVTESPAALVEGETEGVALRMPLQSSAMNGVCPTCGAVNAGAAIRTPHKDAAVPMSVASLSLPVGGFRGHDAALVPAGGDRSDPSPNASGPSPSAFLRGMPIQQQLASSLLPTAETWFALTLGAALVPGSEFAARVGAEVRVEWRKHGDPKAAQGNGDATGEIFSLLKLLGEWCAECLKRLEQWPWPPPTVAASGYCISPQAESGGMVAAASLRGVGKGPPIRVGAGGSLLESAMMEGAHGMEDGHSSAPSLRDILVTFQRQVRDCILTATGLASWGPL